MFIKWIKVQIWLIQTLCFNVQLCNSQVLTRDIKNKFGCKFIRVNTSNAKRGYDTDYKVSKIQIFISEFKDNTIKEKDNTIKEKDN